MLSVVAICIGASLGALMRWGLGLWLSPGGVIPWRTLAANLMGGYLVGVCVAVFQAMPQVREVVELPFAHGRLDWAARRRVAAGLRGHAVCGTFIGGIQPGVLRSKLKTILVTRTALDNARHGQGPSLIEAQTYRLHDHTTADDARRYRPEAEVAAAWERCPIKRCKAFIEAQGHWSSDDEAALIADGTAAAEAAAQAFLNLPPAPPEAMFDHLYASLPRAMAWQREEVMARGPVHAHG